MPLKGLEALRAFDERLPSLLAEVETGDIAQGVARILSEHRAAMESYAADLAALIAWGVDAGTPRPHRFDSRIIEEALSSTLRSAYIAPVVELSLAPDEPTLDAPGLRIAPLLPASPSRRQARLVASVAPNELGILDWATKEGASLLAGVLATREPARAARILAAMPLEVQVRAITSLARLALPTDSAATGLPREVAELLHWEQNRPTPGLDVAVSILEATPRQGADALICSIKELAPEIADEIAKRRFVFDKLLLVDDRGIQNILKEVNTAFLALALKSASPELREKFFRNMSKRVADFLRDDMKLMGPDRMSDIERAQMAITKVACTLRDQGDLFVLGPDDKMIT